MNRTRALAVLALLLFATLVAVGGTGPARAAAPAFVADASGGSTPVTGNVTGPSVLAWGAHTDVTINGTGGPAFAANGTQVGNLTWFASVSGVNTTDVSITPTSLVIVNHTASTALLTVSNISEVITVTVLLSSTYGTQNVSTNLTYVVHVVQPYVLTIVLVAGTSATVLPFNLTIFLDGAPVGSLQIGSITAGGSFSAKFDYAVISLAPGEHTFTASLAQQHGLVMFAGGGTSLSVTFYVAGATPNYTWWYVAGIVAFFGAVFIFLTRVAARRQNPTKK